MTAALQPALLHNLQPLCLQSWWSSVAKVV